jgi:hypothetical protein
VVPTLFGALDASFAAFDSDIEDSTLGVASLPSGEVSDTGFANFFSVVLTGFFPGDSYTALLFPRDVSFALCLVPFSALGFALG